MVGNGTSDVKGTRRVDSSVEIAHIIRRTTSIARSKNAEVAKVDSGDLAIDRTPEEDGKKTREVHVDRTEATETSIAGEEEGNAIDGEGRSDDFEGQAEGRA